MQDELEMEPYKLRTRQKIYLPFKLTIGWLGAFVAFTVFFPVWLIVWCAVKFSSKGPGIFTHSRIGKGRKKFRCCKFRSMYVEAPKHMASRKFDDADQWITPVGKFIRKTSLDECAQILNILSGKMSWIGYRPLVEKEQIEDNLRNELGVYQIRPGITGWAQVKGRDLVSEKDKCLYDRYYLEHMSLWFDIKIFFMTIFKIFKREGIKEGSIEENTKKENDVK